MQINDGHSLYLETLSELGVVGLVLVVLVARRRSWSAGCCGCAGPSATRYGAFVAAGAMLAVHAGIDWDWEMPALFVWLFGAGRRGAGGAARASGPAWELGRLPRVAAALAVLVLAITPWLILRFAGAAAGARSATSPPATARPRSTRR